MASIDTVLSKRFSRRTLFQGTGALGLGLLASQALDFATAGKLRLVAAESESLQDIINIAATAESLAVTLLGYAIQSAQQNKYDTPVPAAVQQILQAARAEEQYHLSYLLAAGAQPLTQTFTVPDTSILTSYDKLFGTVVALESAFIAAYMAAAAELAQLGHPELVKVAYQIAGSEAEHRVLANYALGTRPANDVAFEANMFSTVGDAANALKSLGFIGGSGTQVTYPGPGTIDNTGVDNATPPGDAAGCVAPATSAGSGSDNCYYFKETGHSLCNGFKDYWDAHGGLAIFGYPITEEMQENGRTVQYFERARFEWHPEFKGTKYEVELGLLGDMLADMNDLRGTAPFTKAGPSNASGSVYYDVTGHNLGGGFKRYWESYGGLDIFGYPISEEFQEQNPDTGKTYTVQYFERARFEWHPGEWPERWDVELGRLGVWYWMMTHK